MNQKEGIFMEKATNAIYGLVDFAIQKNLVEAMDRDYAVNRLLEIMGMDAPEECDYTPAAAPETTTKFLTVLLDKAVESGLIEDSGERRDLFSAKLMGVLTPSPAQTRSRFFTMLKNEGPAAAMRDFYQSCRDTDYIRVDRIAKNARFFEDTDAGRLEITINLSKPEKDPRDIAAARNAKQTGYPKCMLCKENPGYAGRIGFPARQNHRVIPLTLGGGQWFLQYSPYLYYDEHCIVFNAQHVPMRISRDTFIRQCDFVDQFPTYMLGSNADLPIVGGSILSHDHFQGGHYDFPMDFSPVRIPLTAPSENVRAYVADWPMSCIVLESADREQIIALSDLILNAWREYSDAENEIFAYTGDTPHNTVTPILRRAGDHYKMQLVLRNNRTSAEHPLGIFHPHADLHHIKKENIGLIEVMGLFILPGRLLNELSALEKYLTGETPLDDAPEESSPLSKHYGWICAIAQRTGTHLNHAQANAALRKALGEKCARVLADAGVFKNTEPGNRGILRFLEGVGFQA